MLKSMTGYGRASFSAGEESFSIEVKSLNHRFLDINCRINERLFALENSVRDEIKKRFSRGAFSVLIYAERGPESALKVNIPAARAYVEAAGALKKELGVPGEVDISLLLKLRDIFSGGGKGLDAGAAWPLLKEGLDMAFSQVEAWRVKEGGALRSDLENRVMTFEGLLSRVEARAPEIVGAFRERLKSEMEKLIRGNVDESRLLAEAAIIAERTDFSEEITRAKSHIGMFRDYLEAKEPAGKRLDFLCQELFREINTIASKANDALIAQGVVELKGELEKIREQVQNIE